MFRFRSLSLPCIPLALLCASFAWNCSAAEETVPLPIVTPDVVYGHKAGMALTYDLIRPAKTNGAVVLFMVSGGWVSGWADPQPLLKQAMAAKDRNAFGMLLERGFSLALVRHGSSPFFKVPDAVSDVRRAVRHIRSNASSTGLNPDQIGVFGGSAGGHLSLMLATTADPGDPGAADETGKMSDRIAAAAAYFPPTELAGYIDDARFPALHFPAAQSDSVSPLKHVTPDDAPCLLVHGGKDTLVPLNHSTRMEEALRTAGVPVKLITFPEAGHGFAGEDEKAASTAVVQWFETHLLPKPAASSPEGVWEAKATLPDGSERSSRLTLRRKDDQWTALAVSEDGERDLEVVACKDGELVMEVEMERDGQSGLIRVQARAQTANQFTGRWSVQDASGTEIFSGDWKASKKD